MDSPGIQRERQGICRFWPKAEASAFVAGEAAWSSEHRWTSPAEHSRSGGGLAGLPVHPLPGCFLIAWYIQVLEPELKIKYNFFFSKFIYYIQRSPGELKLQITFVLKDCFSRVPFPWRVLYFLVFTIAGWPGGKNYVFITLDFVLKTACGSQVCACFKCKFHFVPWAFSLWYSVTF